MKRRLSILLAAGVLLGLSGCVYTPGYYARPGVSYDDGYYYAPGYYANPWCCYGYGPWIGLDFYGGYYHHGYRHDGHRGRSAPRPAPSHQAPRGSYYPHSH